MSLIMSARTGARPDHPPLDSGRDLTVKAVFDHARVGFCDDDRALLQLELRVTRVFDNASLRSSSWASRVCSLHRRGRPGRLALAHLLRRANITFLVLQRQNAQGHRARTKPGMIEPRTVDLLRPYGLADSILKRGTRNVVCEFPADGRAFLLDYGSLTKGPGHYVYPQTSSSTTGLKSFAPRERRSATARGGRRDARRGEDAHARGRPVG